MTERRRTSRANCNFTVSVNLCDTDNDNAPIGTPVKGRIIDFTPHGVCLLLENIKCGNHHIFYTTQDHENHIVSIEYTADDKDDSLVVFGNPAWYNIFSSEADTSKFKLGIEFLANQDTKFFRKFLAKLAGMKDAEGNWLQKLFK